MDKIADTYHTEETVLFVDNEQLTESDQMVNDGSGVTSQGIAAQLEGEEMCHAFFCTSLEDDQWTNNLASKLQSPAYGFKCSNVAHEFDPGVAKMDKVVNALSTSKKIILVLSPDFMSSPWCSYEHLRTLRPYLTNREKVLLVTISDVDLPEFLYGFPTIDSASETFWQTFVGSLQISFSSVDGSPRSSRSKEVLVNGLELGQSSSTSQCFCGARFDTVYCPAGLARKGVVIPQHDFTTAVSTILESSKMRWYSVWYNWYLHMVLTILVTVVVTCGVVFNLTKSIQVIWALVISWLISTIATLMIHLIAYYKRRQLSFHMESFIARANMVVSPHHVLIGMTDRFRGLCFKAVLHFIYYDLEKCKENMVEFLKQHRNTGGSKASSINIDVSGEIDDTSRLTISNKIISHGEQTHITDPSSLDEEAELFLLQSSPIYTKMLIKRKLPPAMIRHSKAGLCLCQFVQWKTFHEPL